MRPFYNLPSTDKTQQLVLSGKKQFDVYSSLLHQQLKSVEGIFLLTSISLVYLLLFAHVPVDYLFGLFFLLIHNQELHS